MALGIRVLTWKERHATSKRIRTNNYLQNTTHKKKFRYTLVNAGIVHTMNQKFTQHYIIT